MTVPYLEHHRYDVITKMMPYMKPQGSYFIRPDGKIDCDRRMDPDPPWAYVEHGTWQNCHLWHKVLFDIIFDQSLVPTDCYQCFKVVVKPRTIVELFAFLKFQQRLAIPGKCGVEGDRPNTDRLYGGYFYNQGVEQGRGCYKYVIGEMEKDNVLSPILKAKDRDGYPKNIILKRACTEFQQRCGPSDTWAPAPLQLEKEAAVKAALVSDVWTLKQSKHMLDHVKWTWINKAMQWGDKTYLKLTGGNPIHRPPVTYHKE